MSLAERLDLGPTDALLGVSASLLGRAWSLAAHDALQAAAIRQRHGLPDLAARMLAARGVALEAVAEFLEPRLRSALPAPDRLRDMDKAAARIARAVTTGERVTVFADYDVDGATSAALLIRFLRAVGCEAGLYVPDRIAEGYGPNGPALLKLRQAGVDLVVTVDCGVAAHDPLAAAAEAGLDMVVIDHHQAEPALPQAHAIVNPNRLDERPGYGHLAAVGVTFLALVAVNRVLRTAGWYDARPEPDLLGWLDLVALGTICDVVPLTGLNRAFVTQGLKVMARRGNPGLAALADVAGLAEPPGTYHAGFLLGPRINAGGRIAGADLGARLLATDDPAEAARLAATLNDCNAERRRIEADVLAAALAQAEAAPPGSSPLLVAGEGWHPGVIGIVASRLVEALGRPVLVLALLGRLGKGSARSVPGFDIGACVAAARRAGLLVAGGGHAMAAGLTVESARVEALAAFLAGHRMGVVARPEMMLDGMVSLGGADMTLAEILDRLSPYGSGHPEPRLAIPDVRPMRGTPVGQAHVRCVLTDAVGNRLTAIAFRALETPLGLALLRPDRPLHVAGRLKRDVWQGQTRLQFQIEDAAPAG